jgi:hypothetical protein
MMFFLKINLKYGTHIYDVYYHKNIKKEKPYVHFFIWGDFKTCV